MNNNWIDVKTKFNSEIIEQEVVIGEHRQNIAREIINLREEGVRAALIKLGWTPPKQKDSE